MKKPRWGSLEDQERYEDREGREHREGRERRDRRDRHELPAPPSHHIDISIGLVDDGDSKARGRPSRRQISRQAPLFRECSNCYNGINSLLAKVEPVKQDEIEKSLRIPVRNWPGYF